MLEITTELDPKLIVAYQFGANFLGPKPPEGAGQPDQAVALVEHGIGTILTTGSCITNLGFIYYYMESKDYAKAAEVSFERGTKVPNAHPFLRVLAAQMAQHAGEIQTSRMLWQAAYAATQDPMVATTPRRTCARSSGRGCHSLTGGRLLRHIRAHWTAAVEH